jgi:hypothetical protein
MAKAEETKSTQKTLTSSDDNKQNKRLAVYGELIGWQLDK